MICKFFSKLLGGEDEKQEPTKEEYFGVLEAEQYLYNLGYVKVLLEDVLVSKIAIYDNFFMQSENEIPVWINIKWWYHYYEQSVVHVSIGKLPGVISLYSADLNLSFKDRINDVVQWINKNQNIINEKRNLIIKEEQLQLGKKMSYLMLPTK